MVWSARLCIFVIGSLILVVNETSAICRVLPTRSATGQYIQHRNSDDYDYDDVNEMWYPVSYSSANCSYVTITLNSSIPFPLYFNTEWDKLGIDHPGFEVMPNFSNLTFEHSNVTTIFVSLFSDNIFKNVINLCMNSTHVRQIQQGGFNGLEKLQMLQLANNELTEIPRGVLNHLSQLRILNVSHNHIHLIESNAFMGLLHLQKIILSHNKIKALHPDTFPSLQLIEVIDLSYNSINDFPKNVFNNISQYDSPDVDRIELDLSHNCIRNINLSYIPVRLRILNLYDNNLTDFVYLNSSDLDYLSLGHNNLSNISTIDSSSLTHLDLSGNKITELNRRFLKDSEYLVVLDISYNSIRQFPDDIFMGMKELQNLALNHNNIFHIPIGCFHSLSALVYLNMSRNQISEFEHGTFSGLSRLITLDISNNTLTYLYESTFHPLVALENLYLDHNFVTSLDPYAITDNLKALKEISINYNLWNCNSLVSIFNVLKSKNVNVINGEVRKVVNVHGIACIKENIEIPTGVTPSTNDFNYQNKQVEDFINSKFYNLFNNLSNNHFEEDKFLNDFTKTFVKILTEHKNDISNANVVPQLDETLSNLVNELRSFPNKLANYSASERDQLREDVYKYFHTENKNQTLQKYAGKDQDSLNAIKQFLNSDFKNSTFYKFFETHDLSKFSEGTKSDAPTFEKYVSDDDRVMTKISSLNALLVIIIVVLCCLLLLFVVKNFKFPLKLAKRNVRDMPTDPHASLELIM